MRSLRTVGLFAGIGGVEAGLERAGHTTVGLCEIEPAAQAVLRSHFAGVPIWPDVRELSDLPSFDLLTAGFPCQDLSQAGRKAGIRGSQSGLVDEVFRIASEAEPPWILIENVSYMLRLDKGRAMDHLVDALTKLGYRWAYRVVDARAFGVPQRRERVILLASRDDDPAAILFSDDEPGPPFQDQVGPVDASCAYGFYWTEGLRGLGWAKDAVPTVKGGSKLGIPSPPAVWLPSTGEIGTPTIEDAERLQGFDVDWTLPAVKAGYPRKRWILVGNAVCVPMATWVGTRLADPPVDAAWTESPLKAGARWPRAARGDATGRSAVDISSTPIRETRSLIDFLDNPLRPLSHRAAAGFLSRARRGQLRFADGFLRDVEVHVDAMAD